MVSTLQGPWGELTVEVEQIEVSSWSPRPDKNWAYTDRNGHRHVWRDGYPSLIDGPLPGLWVLRARRLTRWLRGHDFRPAGLRCRMCGEFITPGMLGPSPYREFAPGRRTFLLDGKPISEERYREIRRSIDAERG